MCHDDRDDNQNVDISEENARVDVSDDRRNAMLINKRTSASSCASLKNIVCDQNGHSERFDGEYSAARLPVLAGAIEPIANRNESLLCAFFFFFFFFFLSPKRRSMNR
jgi:hypothetical protein